jgi:hypothetical protein
VKVSELEGAQLDYWVAKTLGDRQMRIVGAEEHERCETRFGDQWPWNRFMPSLAWMDGGTIIEREEICTEPHAHFVEENGATDWRATIFYDGGERYDVDGPTPLIAAMRAYVASKFGDTVPDEVEA